MIPRAHITAWRASAPWSNDAQIEQDLVVCSALVDLYSDPLLTHEVAFRGGTALHKLLLNPAGRYSEDIDLVQVKVGAIGPIMDAVRARLDPWLGKPQWKQSAGRVTFYYRFESEVKPITPLKLKVETNTREHFFVLGPPRPLRSEEPVAQRRSGHLDVRAGGVARNENACALPEEEGARSLRSLRGARTSRRSRPRQDRGMLQPLHAA